MKQYSFLKGLEKSGTQFLIFGLGIVSFVLMSNFQAIGDATIWSLVEENLKPVLGGLTVGGLVTLAINWLKNR